MVRKRRNNQIQYDDEMFTVDDPNASSDLTFDEAVELFIKDGKLRNLSEYTLKYYRNELMTAKKLLTQQEVEAMPHRITPQIIEENLIYYMIEDMQLKPNTVNTRLRAIRAFFNFLYKKRHIPLNPMRDSQLLRTKKNNIATFSREQIGRLLSQPDLRTFTGVRDYTIILLFLETGIRAKELESLEINDIQWDENKIIIRNPKGHRVRMVPIQADMIKQLKKYMALRGTSLGTDALFLTIDDTPLTKRQVQHRISDYGKKAGITNVRCSPHTFRHTFSKMCVQGGANIFELQQILGHSSMEMVRNYVNLFSDEVRERHREFSPLRQLKR